MADEAMVPNRDEVRAAIFSGKHKPRSVKIRFFGTEIEIRQLTVEQTSALALGMQSEGDAIVQTLLNMAFVPGTDQKVFDPADVDSLKKLPNGPDMTRVAEAVKELVEKTDEDFGVSRES